MISGFIGGNSGLRKSVPVLVTEKLSVYLVEVSDDLLAGSYFHQILTNRSYNCWEETYSLHFQCLSDFSCNELSTIAS